MPRLRVISRALSRKRRSSLLRANVGVPLARGLRRHPVGGGVALAQLEGDAERGPARPSAAGVRATAPVLAEDDGVEAVELVRDAVSLDRAEQTGFVAALAFGRGAGGEFEGSFELERER